MIYDILVTELPNRKQQEAGKCERVIFGAEQISADCQEAAIYSAGMRAAVPVMSARAAVDAINAGNFGDAAAFKAAALAAIGNISNLSREAVDALDPGGFAANTAAFKAAALAQIDAILGQSCLICIYVRPFGEAVCCPPQDACYTPQGPYQSRGVSAGAAPVAELRPAYAKHN